MTRNAKEFEAVGDEKVIYLLQVDKDKKPIAQENVLEVNVPKNETDVLIGLYEPAPWIASTAGDWLAFIAGILFLSLLAVFALLVLIAIARKEISLKFLIAEPDGKASLSRFQALIFTFVFMIGILLILLETGKFPTDIPPAVLAILGGSLGTYLISKGITGAGTTPGAPGHAPSGPLVRYTPPATPGRAEFDSAGIPVKSEPFKISIPTTAKGPNNLVPVAVAVGQSTLKFSFSEPDGGLDQKIVSYLDGAGKLVQVTLTDSMQIQTPPNRITEVSVQFKSKATNGVVNLEVTTA